MANIFGMATSNAVIRKNRERWFPVATLLAAVVMGAGFLLLDFQLAPWPITLGVPLVLLVALTMWGLRTSVAPPKSGSYLLAATLLVLALRAVTGAAVSFLSSSPLLVVLAAIVTVSPLLFVAALYYRRLN